MKRFLWLGCVVAAALALNAEAELRPFSLPDGRTIEAEIIEYNAKLDRVELKRADGKLVKVKPSIFVEKDQAYIKEWALLSNVFNKSNLKVDFKEKIEEKWRDDTDAHQRAYERVVYELTLENKAQMPIDGLAAEYRIFYEQEENIRKKQKNDDGFEKVLNSKVLGGKLDIGTLEPKAAHEVSTDSVVLEKFEFNLSDYYYPGGDPESTSGEVTGIWLRLSVTTPGGQRVERDFFEPQGIEGKYAWELPKKQGKKGKKKRKKRA